MRQTEALARFLSELQFEDLPTDVIETAKLCVLDTVGVGLAASRRAWSSMAAVIASDSASEHGSTLWGRPRRSDPMGAALANGTAAHGIEMDDRVPAAQLHPGSSAVPAALALLEAHDGTGMDLITAVVAGYELGVRVGRSFQFKKSQGIHVSGHKAVWSGVGAAGRSLKLSPTSMRNAMGLAGSMASGLSEFSEDPHGTMVKRLHGGLGAQHGVLAGVLAREGMTGPATVLEGKYGYCSVFAPPGQPPDLAVLTDQLGARFQILDRETKPYAAWGGSHNAIDAVKQITERSSVEPLKVERVSIAGSDRLIRTHELQRPSSMMAAQYSLPFLTAVAICYGADSFGDPDTLWTDELLRDPVVAQVASCTDLRVDARLERLSREHLHYGGAHVTIHMKDGSVHTAAVTDSLGTLANPMTREQVREKFVRLASPVLTQPRVNEVWAAVDDLEGMHSVRRLGDLLAVS